MSGLQAKEGEVGGSSTPTTEENTLKGRIRNIFGFSSPAKNAEVGTPSGSRGEGKAFRKAPPCVRVDLELLRGKVDWGEAGKVSLLLRNAGGISV